MQQKEIQGPSTYLSVGYVSLNRKAILALAWLLVDIGETWRLW